MKTLLTSGEAAAMIGKSVDSIRYYERTGRLNAVRVGAGIRLFDRSEIERFGKGLKNKRIPKQAGR